MECNLFDLEDSEEDNTNRKLLRIYSVIPRFSKIKTGPQAEQALLVTEFLNQINSRLKKEIAPNWKDQWMALIGHDFSKASYKDWFIGRASIPLLAMQRLSSFGIENEVNYFLEKIHYIASTTGDVVCIPKNTSPDLLYLCGIILGDGSLPRTRKPLSNNLEYKTLIHSGDRENLFECATIFTRLFSKKSRIYFRTNKRGSCWTLEVKNKAIYRLFTNILKIPHGDKGSTGHIPPTIKSLSPNLISAFLSGMVDSDIGKHGHGMGGTFKSKTLVLDLIEELEKLNIHAKHYGTHYKDHQFAQHDFTIPKGQMKKFKELLEKNYLPKRKDRLNALYSLAGVP